MSVLAASVRGRISAVIWTAIFGLGIGCASVNEGVAGDEGTARVAQPSSSCSQLLALLSDENKQPLLPKYGPGGSCWTAGRSEAKQCDESCAQQVSDLLHNAVKRNREQS
ncbi:MAG TPA: hypothetical protein PKI03_14860 [Pseudomonadota bacterium]|nr:hypothetical protein [Pseudomonadota bacterium]